MFEVSETHQNVFDYSLVRHLLMENKVMADFAFDSGLKPNAADIEQLQHISDEILQLGEVPLDESKYVKDLTRIHNNLSSLVKPASPRSLLLLVKREDNSMLRFYGSVPLVRRFMILSILSLILLVLVSLPKEQDGKFNIFASDGHTQVHTVVTEDTLGTATPAESEPAEAAEPAKTTSEKKGIFGWLTSMLDWVMGLKYLLLLCAASLGACFSSLYTANQFIKDSTFDDMNESTYWARYTLGLMAGMMMSLLIPLETFGLDGTNLHGLEKPTLALLGGFAANFVYQIMARMVALMEASVKGDPKKLVAAAEAQARQRVAMKGERARMKQMQDLADLQRQLGDGTSIEEARQAIAKMQAKINEG